MCKNRTLVIYARRKYETIFTYKNETEKHQATSTRQLETVDSTGRLTNILTLCL